MRYQQYRGKDNIREPLDELRKEWTEKGYEEDPDPRSTTLMYSAVQQGVTHFDLDKDLVDQTVTWDVMKRFIAYVDDSTGGNMLPNPAVKGKSGEYIFNQTVSAF